MLELVNSFLKRRETMSSIKIEVPAEPKYIEAAAEFFAGLAGEPIDHRVIEVSKKLATSATESIAAIEDPIKVTRAVVDAAVETIIESDQGPTTVVDESIAQSQTAADSPPAQTGGNYDKWPAKYTATGVEIDENGLPWDNRIHSGKTDKRSKLAKTGAWKYKKNTPDELIAQVEAELKAAMGAAATITAKANPTDPTPQFPTTGVVQDDPPVAPVSAIDVVTKAMDLQGKGVPEAEVLACFTAVGLPTVMNIQVRSDLAPQVMASLNQIAVPV